MTILTCYHQQKQHWQHTHRVLRWTSTNRRCRPEETCWLDASCRHLTVISWSDEWNSTAHKHQLWPNDNIVIAVMTMMTILSVLLGSARLSYVLAMKTFIWLKLRSQEEPLACIPSSSVKRLWSPVALRGPLAQSWWVHVALSPCLPKSPAALYYQGSRSLGVYQGPIDVTVPPHGVTSVAEIS